MTKNPNYRAKAYCFIFVLISFSYFGQKLRFMLTWETNSRVKSKHVKTFLLKCKCLKKPIACNYRVRKSSALCAEIGGL